MYENIEKLEASHRVLMNEYFNLINQLTKLPFFVDIWELRPSHNPQERFARFWKFLVKISLPFRFLLRMFCWRPIVRLFVESHIKNKVKELGKSYFQLLQTFTTPMKQAKEYKWLIEVSESYSEFADTFTSWKSLTGFFATVGTIAINLVIVWFGAKSAYDLAKDFITNINFGALSR